MIGLLPIGWGETFVNLGSPQANIFWAIECERFGTRAIAASTADFLIVALDRFGQICVGDPADVGFVDAHAEGDGRNNDECIFCVEAVLDAAAFVRVHCAMVVAGIVTLVAQSSSQRFCFGTCGAIDNPTLATPRACIAQYLLARLVFGREGEADVWSVKPVQEPPRFCACEQAGNDFVLGFVVCCGGESGKGNTEIALKLADPQIIGAEVMAPLTDAMRFVNRDARNTCVAQDIARHG